MAQRSGHETGSAWRRPKGGGRGCKADSSEKAYYRTQVDRGEWPASPLLEQPCRRDHLTGIPGAIDKAGHEASVIRLAATVPTTTPITTAGSARRPSTIIMPAATPDAGQTITRSEDAEIKARPSRVGSKYAMAITPAATSVVIHPRASAA